MYVRLYTHRLIAPVPCELCCGVAFCSPKCRDLAVSSYHRWECRFLDLMIGSGVSLNVSLALRVAAQHDLEFFQKVRGSRVPIPQEEGLKCFVE